MPHIVLTEEQAKLVVQAAGSVEVRDSQGRIVGALTVFDPREAEMIAKAKQSRTAGGPRIPSERVQAFLRKLHEVEQTEGIDQAKVDELLRRTVAGEPL